MRQSQLNEDIEEEVEDIEEEVEDIEEEVEDFEEEVEDFEDEEADSHIAVPKTDAEARFIRLLLPPIIENFQGSTGLVGSETNYWASYADQFRVFQEALGNYHHEQGIYGAGKELVHLLQININGVKWSSLTPPATLYGRQSWPEFGPKLNSFSITTNQDLMAKRQKATR